MAERPAETLERLVSMLALANTPRVEVGELAQAHLTCAIDSFRKLVEPTS